MTGGTLRLTGGQVVTPNGTAESLDVTVADGTIIGVEARPGVAQDEPGSRSDPAQHDQRSNNTARHGGGSPGEEGLFLPLIVRLQAALVNSRRQPGDDRTVPNASQEGEQPEVLYWASQERKRLED